MAILRVRWCSSSVRTCFQSSLPLALHLFLSFLFNWMVLGLEVNFRIVSGQFVPLPSFHLMCQVLQLLLLSLQSRILLHYLVLQEQPGYLLAMVWQMCFLLDCTKSNCLHPILFTVAHQWLWHHFLLHAALASTDHGVSLLSFSPTSQTG